MCKSLKTTILDNDVLCIERRLQQCKREGRRSGQVIVNFDPHGNINLNQVLWVAKAPLENSPEGDYKFTAE